MCLDPLRANTFLRVFSFMVSCLLGPHVRGCFSISPVSALGPLVLFPLSLCGKEQGCAAMECHGYPLPGRYVSTGAKDTMSATVKPAKEFHETDVGQPTAACQLMVCPSRSTLVTKGAAPTRGAKDTEERVYGTVTLTTFFRDKLWRAMLSLSLSASRWLVSW